MKNLRSFLFKTAFISAVFFISHNFAFAEVPSITSVKLSGVSDSVIFNPNQGKLSIEISANKLVKFNTIAICLKAEETCSRSKSVKYFTSYDMAQSVIKEWDGNTGGSSPTLVDAGEYKIAITIDDDENDPVTENPAYIIKVDYSADSSGSSNATSTEVVAQGSSGSSGVSSHSGAETVSSYKEPTGVFEVSAGRERVVYVGTPVYFAEKHKASSELKDQYQTYAWSLGDGSRKEGTKIEHIYKFPGEHIVILNATCGQYASVSRTTVKVLAPELALNAIPGGFEIENKGKYEINLGGWKITSGLYNFIIPNDTIVGEKKKIVMPFEYANIKENILLQFAIYDTRGIMVSEYHFVEPTSEVQAIQEIKPVVSVQKVENKVSVSVSDTYNVPAISSTSTMPTSTESISVATTSGGILKKIINLPVSGIRAVKDTFYESE